MTLGLPLTDVMRRTTPRQFVVWQAWLAIQWNEPDRTDHYLMQLAAEIRRGNVKNPGTVRDEKFRIRFGFEDEPAPTPSRELAAQMSKAAWVGRMTTVVRRETVTPPRETPPS